MVSQDFSTTDMSFGLTSFFLKCCVPTSNFATAVNHQIFYYTLQNPWRWVCHQSVRGACISIPISLHWLHIRLLLLLLDWLLGSFHCITMDFSWWDSLWWLKAGATLGLLSCSSVYLAVKFTASWTLSLCRGDRVPSPLNRCKNGYPNTWKWGCTGFWTVL